MNIAVYCGANPGNNPAYRTAAKELGTWIGENNHRLIYGGGDVGLMGEVANACLAAGGEAIGFMPQFLIDREIAHDHLTQLITVQTMSERKQKMLDKSDICVALPGGPGTMEEIIEAISWERVGQSTNPCFLYSVVHYYDDLADHFQRMVTEGFLTEDDYSRVHFITSLSDLEAYL